MLDTRLVNDVASQISSDTLRDFGAALGGGLLSPGAPGYDDARRVWNGMIDRRPGLIARCVNATDVRRAWISRERTGCSLPSVAETTTRPARRSATAV